MGLRIEKLPGAVGERDLLAGLDGPFDGEVATRLQAKNTSSSKSHAFSYVSSPFDLNDGNDILFIGDDAFCNNVSSLEKQGAFLADKGLKIDREAWGRCCCCGGCWRGVRFRAGISESEMTFSRIDC